MLFTNRVTDKIDHPRLSYVLNPSNLEPVHGLPAYNVPYLDPSFGTIITRITAVNPAEGEDAVIKPMYSTMPAWNCDESLLILWHREQGHELYEGDAPYRYLGNLGISPTDIEHVIWDPFEPLTFYYPTKKNGGRCQLIMVNLRDRISAAKTETVHYDFSSAPVNCPIGNASRFGLGNDPEGRLGPRRLLGLMGGNNGELKIIYSITEARVIVHFTQSGFGPIAPVVAPSEETVYIGGGYVYEFPTFRGIRKLVSRSYFEHSQVGRDMSGDTWNTIAFNESSPGANDAGALVVHNLRDGTREVIIGPATGYGYIPSGTHISTLGPAGLVLVSTVGGARTGAFTGDNEMFIANTDTREVARIGHTRTWAGTLNPGPSGYWGETHASLSPLGTRVIFGSDGLGFTGLPYRGVNTYVVDLRKDNLDLRVTSRTRVKSFSPSLQAVDWDVERYEVVQ